jgi:hypothetical protein
MTHVFAPNLVNALCFVAATSCFIGTALAQEPPLAPAPATAPAEAAPAATPPAETATAPLPAPDLEPPPVAPSPKPPPYSTPFLLRPVTAASVVRSDNSFAPYENRLGQGGFAYVSELVGAWRIPGTGDKPGTGLAPLVKLTLVSDSPPPTVKATGMTTPGTGGVAVVNPLIGASYALSFGSGFRGSVFFGVTIPIGMGGGNTPDAGELDARKVGPNVRAGMDNSLFAVNDIAFVPGVDLAYVDHGFTAQIEATLFQLERVRGEASQPEAHKTNFTSGLHLGYFVIPMVSLGAELHYQRWINAPIAVDNHTFGTSVDLASVTVGPRVHFKLGKSVWLRPGVSFTRGFEHPLSSPGNYNVVGLDVPVVF